MYLKDKSNGGENKKFFVVPGLRGEEGATSLGLEKRSYGECKYNCFIDETCSAFAYNKQTEDCNGLQGSMEYDEGFQYFEKKVPLDGGKITKRQVMAEKIAAENKE